MDLKCQTDKFIWWDIKHKMRIIKSDKNDDSLFSVYCNAERKDASTFINQQIIKIRVL